MAASTSTSTNLTNEEKLRRLLYTSCFNPKYIPGDILDYSLEGVSRTYQLIEDLAKDNPSELLTIVTVTSQDKLLPRRCILFYVLARAVTCNTIAAERKHQVIETTLQLCKSDEELFHFVNFCSLLRGTHKTRITNSVIKGVKQFYKKKSAEDLVKSYCLSPSYYSWAHKDLIKYCHVNQGKPEEFPAKKFVVKYILFKKYETAELKPEEKQLATQLTETLKKIELIRTTENPAIAVPIINEFKLKLNQIYPRLQKFPEVWNAILPNMTLQRTLKLLPKLYKLGLLKANTPTEQAVVNMLTDSEKVKASEIHPVEVFIHTRNYEKGGRPIDPKLESHLIARNVTEEELNRAKFRPEPKCPSIRTALYKCLKMSYNNVQSTGKRFLITIDVTPKMDTLCISNKNFTCLEGALTYARSLIRIEKSVTLAVFNNMEIQIISFQKGTQFQDNVQTLHDSKCDFLIPAAPIEWAQNRKKNIDIFINFISTNDYIAIIPREVRDKMQEPVSALIKYRRKFSLPNAKLITVCMSSAKFIMADGSPNVIDICGFDLVFPKVIGAFYNDHFS